MIDKTDGASGRPLEFKTSGASSLQTRELAAPQENSANLVLYTLPRETEFPQISAKQYLWAWN